MKEQDEYMDETELDLLEYYDEEDVEYVKEILFHGQWDKETIKQGCKNAI